MDLPNTSFEWNSGRRNLVRIVAIEEKGWLFVNGSFVSTLKLTGLSGKMTLRVCVYSVRDLGNWGVHQIHWVHYLELAP